MALNGDARAQAIFSVMSAGANFSKLSPDEQTALLNGLRLIYGADTTYLKSNASIVPGTFSVPTGVPVTTAGTATAQTGATTAPGVVSGAGNLT